MSTGDRNIVIRCASCGNECGDDPILKTCAACKMVKYCYCSVQCQKAHVPKHEEECGKRATEFSDEKLFGDPPPRQDCPVCFLPLPIARNQMNYQSCCGKQLCKGCIMMAVEVKGHKLPPCPFCREVFTSSPASSGKEHVQRLRKRMQANDLEAFVQLGSDYHYGRYGLPQDSNKAFELWSKAAEIGSAGVYGSASVYCALGFAYNFGWGVEVDIRKAAHYFELAAMEGCTISRHYMGSWEFRMGNKDRAMKHWMIAAMSGYDESLESIKQGYRQGHVSKEDFAKALRAHQKSVNEMKSEHRDKVASDGW